MFKAMCGQIPVQIPRSNEAPPVLSDSRRADWLKRAEFDHHRTVEETQPRRHTYSLLRANPRQGKQPEVDGQGWSP